MFAFSVACWPCRSNLYQRRCSDGVMVLGFYGFMVLWFGFYGFVVLWFYDFMVVWLYGVKALLFYSLICLWLRGFSVAKKLPNFHFMVLMISYPIFSRFY